MKIKKTRTEILKEFYASPVESLFNQETLCAVMDCSKALAERNRWAGLGVPFLKIGSSVRYRKSDILSYLETQKFCNFSDKINIKIIQLPIDNIN